MLCFSKGKDPPREQHSGIPISCSDETELLKFVSNVSECLGSRWEHHHYSGPTKHTVCFFFPFFCLRLVKQSEWTAPEAVSLSSPPWFMNCKRFQGFKTCPPGKKTVYLTFYRGTLNVLPLLVLDHTFEVQGTLSIYLKKKKKEESMTISGGLFLW